MIEKDINGFDVCPVEVKDLMGHLRFEGRNLYEENSVTFGWECSAFEFCGEFEGEISMDVDIVNTFYVDIMHRILFYVEVDGVATKIGPYTDEPKNIVLCNVEKGFHKIKVIKNTAPIFNKYTLKALRYKGVMGEKPADKKLTFEFLGDSVTAGSCIMSHETEIEDLDLDTSADAYYSYPAIVARNFDANLKNIAVHGIGIFNREDVFNTNGPSIYDYTEYYHAPEKEWDFASSPSDVVVIALGANDSEYNDKKPEYYRLAKDFLLHIRKKNPDAYIYWIFGMVGDGYGDFCDTLRHLIEYENDGKMKYIYMPADNTGGYDHPGRSGHAKLARILTEDFRDRLNFTPAI